MKRVLGRDTEGISVFTGINILAGRLPFGCLDDACVPRDILNAKERGAKLVVIDPIFRTEAAKADWWIPIKPGGDAAMFLGMCHHLLVKGLYNKTFGDKCVREGHMEKLMDCGLAWSIFLVITGNLDNPGGQPLPEIASMAPVQPVSPAPNLKELVDHQHAAPGEIPYYLRWRAASRVPIPT